MALEFKLVKFAIVEAAEFRSQTTEAADQSKLRGDEVNNKAEARFPGERETILRFRLHLSEGISHC